MADNNSTKARTGKHRPVDTIRLTVDLPIDVHNWLGKQKAETRESHTDLVRSLLDETMLDSRLLAAILRRVSATATAAHEAAVANEGRPPQPPERTRRLTVDLSHPVHDWLIRQKAENAVNHTELLRAVIEQAMNSPSLVRRANQRSAKRRIGALA